MAAVSFATLPTPPRAALSRSTPTRPKPNYIKIPIDPARLRLVAKTKLRTNNLRQDRDLRLILSHVQLLETTEKELEKKKDEEKFWREHRLATARALEQARLNEWKEKIVCAEEVRFMGGCGGESDLNFEVVQQIEDGVLGSEWFESW